MSTTVWLFWGLIFSSIGMGYFIYGRKRPNITALVCGLGLMIYPCFIDSTWPMIAIGAVLMAIPYYVRF